MATATLTDVAESLGRPITDPLEVAQVNRWLSNVELLIRARAGDVAALDPDVLVYVETEAVIRKIRNPEGKVSEDIDDYRYRLNTDAARGAVFITDDEWALLLPRAPRTAFTIRPVFG